MNSLKEAFEKSQSKLLIEVKTRQEKEKELLKLARFMLIDMDKNSVFFNKTKSYIHKIAFNGTEDDINNAKFALQMLFFPKPSFYESNKKCLLNALKMPVES